MRSQVCGSRFVRLDFVAPAITRLALSALLAVVLCWPAGVLAAAASGPTLHLSDGQGGSGENSVADFMYFVPLISPEPVSVATEAGVEHRVRMLAITRREKSKSFLVKAEYEFIGSGLHQSLVECTNAVQRHQSKLKHGGKLEHLLSAIMVHGPGKGTIEIEGVLTNGIRQVTEVRLRFNAHGQTSPVSIALHDFDFRDGAVRSFNEVVARVNTLSFHRKDGRPKMEVTVASLKAKEAKDSFWQNLKGGIKGLAVNLLIPPLEVAPCGHDAMIEFGQAFASQAAQFTFPLATNLVSTPTQSP